MKVFSGTANPVLTEHIVSYLGTTLGEIEISRFPDGETFVKLRENIRGKDVYAVQPVCMPPNERLMELLIMIDAMRRASAQRITAVLPYYGYARQDRKDQPRVPITAKLVANLLVAAGADRILTIDLHAQQIQGFFDIPVDHLHAAPVFVKYLQEKQLSNVAVASPDTGGVKTAYDYAQRLDCGLVVVAKQRKSPTEVEAFTLAGDVAGRAVLIVDDMTTTAGTLCSAASIIAAHGAKEIYAAVTHATITPLGLQRIRDSAITELIVSDTIPLPPEAKGAPVTVLSVAPLLGEAIRRIHEDESVSSLFRP